MPVRTPMMRIWYACRGETYEGGKMAGSERHIVAIGGAGLSVEDGLQLERYALGLAKKDRPRVCYIGTASADREEGRERFYNAMSILGAEASHLALLPNPNTADPASVLLKQDVIYVGGGNSKNLMALWQAWGIDHLVRAAWEAGTVLAGVSAGSLCWFEEGTTDSVPGKLTAYQYLGFLSGSHCPHYDSEPERRPLYRRLVGAGLMLPGYAADDGVGLHFAGTEIHRIVSSRPDARGWRMERDENGFVETAIVPEYLGGTSTSTESIYGEQNA